jgi:hypothetical protein
MAAAVTWAVGAAATWVVVGVAVLCAALGAAVAVWRWPAAGAEPTGIAVRSFVMDGSYIAITGSFSSEDRSLPRTDLATTAGVGCQLRGDHVASGFVVINTKPLRPPPAGVSLMGTAGL